MATRRKVLILGAAGRMATMLIPGLAEKYDLSGIDLRLANGIESLVADMRDLESIRPAFAGVDAVIDFANHHDWRNTTWEMALENDLPATYNGLLAAQKAGVKRYIFT